MRAFPNLVPYVPCLSEMIEPGYQHPELWFHVHSHYVKRQFDIESLDRLLEEHNKQYNLENFKKYFWPDGGHPNRYGYEILYNKICKDFNL